jgi:hypothetical protein
MEKDFSPKPAGNEPINVSDTSDSESDDDTSDLDEIGGPEHVQFEVDDEVDLRSALLRDMLAADEPSSCETPVGPKVVQPAREKDDMVVDWDW